MNSRFSIFDREIHRGLLASVSVIVGAGITICVLRVPKMWSPEAAGWASAVGTIGAVLVSLWLASERWRKETKASRSRARWVALELRHVLSQWRGRTTYAHCANGAELFQLLTDEGLLNPTLVPADLTSLYDQLHVLGDDAAPIADAIWIARKLHRMPIREALKGDLEPGHAAQLERDFRHDLNSLRMHLLQAEENVSTITGLSSADPEG